MTLTTRIDRRFSELNAEGRGALVTFITAGDPNLETSLEILKALPENGADIIELGMPFSDPMADGPAIQLASERALAGGHTMAKTLDMVRRFREDDDETPLVLMGYYNPIYHYGPEKFVKDAHAAGVDGLIVVDVPPEADDELCLPALAAGLNFIRLATPTTDDERLPKVLENTSGFLYYVSVTGITGVNAPDVADVLQNVARIKTKTSLPVAVGFGLKSAEQVRAILKGTEDVAGADAVVVGSAIVREIEASLDEQGQPGPGLVGKVNELVAELATGVKS